MSDTVLQELHEGVLVLTLNRPPDFKKLKKK